MFDSKEEIAAQVANMLDKQGRKVAVIDDMGVHPEFAHLRVNLNPFGAAVATYRHDQRDLVFTLDTIVNALIPEPAGGDAKNKWFRDVPRDINRFGIAVLLKNSTALATPGSLSDILCDPAMLKGLAEIEATEGHPMLQALARTVLEAASHESWPQHVSEARRSLYLFSPGTRLHDAGINASISHEDLIREGYIIFLVGPQRFMNSLGPYYALHILAFCDALYNGAGALRILADEFTNSPLASMVSALTTLRAFGGEAHMISQSRSEVIRKFGAREAETIEDNSITKHWLSFSFEEAERVSKAMGEQHAVAEGLNGERPGLKTQTNMSLIKQPQMSPAELMALPRGQVLTHIQGVGFFRHWAVYQNQIAPYCNLIADNPLEGKRLPPDPKVKLVIPGRKS